MAVYLDLFGISPYFQARGDESLEMTKIGLGSLFSPCK
jgi:hypothetical protein